MSTPQARLFVIAAPSGAGKTTLVRRLTDRHPELRFSISYTTRKRRSTETHGIDYLFVDEAEFAALKEQGELLESATVFDNRYATSRSQVERHLEAGHPVLLEIDWQGARQVREAMPESVSIFILPPALEELERRLRRRRTDSDQVIARRLRDAKSDLSHWDEFDYVVINDDLERAVEDIDAILADDAEHLATRNEAVRAAVARTLRI